MWTDNPYDAVRRLSLLQQQAGVDPEMAELVVAFAKIRADQGEDFCFYDPEVPVHQLARQFIHESLLRNNKDMDPRVLSFLVAYGNAMAARSRPIIYSVDHLAEKWNMSPRRLRWMAHNQNSFYKSFFIPKANGSPREIHAPEGTLLTRQRWILKHILMKGRAHKYACGFVRGRSIMDNARPHISRSVVVRIDLKDFFPSITHRQARKVFEDYGYPYRVANLLANLCTIDGHLPQGAPTSPVISNLVAKKLDRRFTTLKQKLGYRYSRYADDLVFSSNNQKLPKLIPFFKEVIADEGFCVNEKKVRVMRRGHRQQVTGVVVNEKTSIPRKQARKLRAAVHRAGLKGAESVELGSRRGRTADPLCALQGHISFAEMVDPRVGQFLRRGLEAGRI